MICSIYFFEIFLKYAHLYFSLVVKIKNKKIKLHSYTATVYKIKV